MRALCMAGAVAFGCAFVVSIGPAKAQVEVYGFVSMALGQFKYYSEQNPPVSRWDVGSGGSNVGIRDRSEIGAGLGAWYLDGIPVGNGNFNTDVNVTGPAFGGALSVPLPPGGTFAPRSFQARFFFADGSASTNLNGNAGTFRQANGDSQAINLDITSGRTTAEFTQIGGEALVIFDHPMRDIGMIFSPLFGVGFERATLDTTTSVAIAQLNFQTSDSRRTVTDRLFITGGINVEVPTFGDIPDAPTLFFFGKGRINFDHVNGTAVYDTSQLGVFQELLRNEFSRTAVTFGGHVGGGVAKNFVNGGRFVIGGSIGSVPLHELKFHPGRPATLEHSNHLNFTAGASLNIQLLTSETILSRSGWDTVQSNRATTTASGTYTTYKPVQVPAR